MTLPTFFIIGAPKCGTTSLYVYLSHHPEIGMSAKKEPHFFVDGDNIAYPARRIADRGEYEQLFDERFAVRGESSPSYAEYPRHKGAPERIKALVPGASFIYLVRDPVQRTVSHYQHRVSMEGERRPIEAALGDLADPYCPYTCASLYATQLERYLSHFSQERVLVVDQADLRANRAETLREIFAFLGVDPSYESKQFDEEQGTTSGRRMYRPGYLRFAERAGRSPLRVMPRSARRALRRTVERALWPPLQTATIEPQLRARLTDMYARETDRLRALTGKPFATWSL